MLVASEWQQQQFDKVIWVRTVSGCDVADMQHWLAYVSPDGISHVRISPFCPDNFDMDDENWIQSTCETIDPLGWCDSLLEKLGHSLPAVELKPCPLCAGEAQTYESDGYQQHTGSATYNDIGVQCSACGLHIQER